MTKLPHRLALVLVASVSLGLSSVWAWAAPGPRAAAQHGPTTFRVAAGAGSKQAGPTLSTPVSPKPLTSKQRKSALRGLGIKTPPGPEYAHVAPGHANAPGKMALVFVGTSVVNGIAGFASFAGHGNANTPPAKVVLASTKDPQYAGLWIKAEHAGARYLLECGVSADEKLNIGLAADGSASQVQALPAGASQVTWFFESPDDKWHSFQLRAHFAWSFHGCTATRVP